jgi:hypothetical protein
MGELFDGYVPNRDNAAVARRKVLRHPIVRDAHAPAALLDLHEWRLARDEIRLVPPAAARESAISGRRSSEGVPADPTDDIQTRVHSPRGLRLQACERGGAGATCKARAPAA